MKTYLLDTNIFSDVVTGAHPATRAAFARHAQDQTTRLCLSVVTEAEIRYGMAKHSLSKARRAAIESLFAYVQILPWGAEEAAVYGRLRARLEAEGITVAAMDLLIAAQAIAAEAVLVSRDRIFTKIGEIQVVENWSVDG
jgi:tRNA(fMet)-specific endonuclease VapC